MGECKRCAIRGAEYAEEARLSVDLHADSRALRARVAELEAERKATAREHLRTLNSLSATIEALEAERACDE